jgi:acetylornithine/N-succinyldiaminopimelate aminotransferase
VKAKGELLRALLARLAYLPRVKEVRGLGMMWGIELNEAAAAHVAKCFDAGLLVTSAGDNVIRLLPPLVVSEREIAAAVQTITEVLQ